VALIALVTDEPAVTVLLPELVREKSNDAWGWLTMKEALAWALGLYPLLKATALITALLVKVIAPL
jgi:hypothetical protein